MKALLRTRLDEGDVILSDDAFDILRAAQRVLDEFPEVSQPPAVVMLGADIAAEVDALIVQDLPSDARSRIRP